MNPRTRTRIRIILFAALLAGCTTQSYRDKPLAPAETQSGYEARTLEAADLREFLQRNLKQKIEHWPPRSWDLDLLTLAAFYYHPDLDVARANWGVAEAGIITAGQRPNPQLIASGVEYNFDASPGVSPWKLFALLDIPIETAGKRGYRVAQARRQSLAALFDIETAAWRVRSRVRASLIELYPIEPTLEKQRELLRDIVKLLERRLAVGLVPQPEVTQARLTLFRIEVALNETRKQRAQQRVRLASALGLPASALDAVTFSLTDFERAPSLTGIPTQDVQRAALLSRPDLLAALAEYEARQAALQLEIAKQYPDIHLQPGYTWDAGASKWALGPTLELPVLNRNEGPIAEAKAHREQAAANFAALQARAIGEVEQAAAGYAFSLGKLEAVESALSALRQNERTAAASYRAGEVDRLALVSAQFETLSAEQARIEVLIQTHQAVGQLEDALQRPLGERMLPLRQTESPRPGKAQP